MAEKKSFFEKYLEFPVMYKIAIGFVLGIVVGFVIGPPIAVIKPLGDFFIRLLEMLALPLIIFTLIVGAASISPKKLGRIGGKVIGWYFITSFIAAFLGIGIGLIFNPGAGFTLAGVEYTPPPPANFVNTTLNWIPANPFKAMAEYDIIPVIIFILMFGIGLTYVRGSKEARMKDIGDTLYKVCEAGAEIMYKIVKFVLEVAPYGVFALIAVVIGTTGMVILAPFARLIGAAALATAIMILLVYSGLLTAFKINPFKFIRGAKDAWLTAFVTRSSSGTLPVTMPCAEKNFGIDKSIYSFSLPIGATINMDGTAIYQTIVAVFAANIVGVHLTPAMILTIIVVAVMASVGTAGVPSAGLIMLTVTLSAVGLPLEVIGLVAGIDVILDMMRTSDNVMGDLAVTNIVSKTEKATDWNVGVWR